MSSSCLTARWSIPGIGVLRPRYDAVRIVSSATVGTLKKWLPIADLKKASHKFDVVRYRGKYPALRSEIRVTGTDDLSPWQILAKHEQALGSYRIVQVEIAFDIRPRARANTNSSLGESADGNARKKLFALVGLLAKPRHYREYLISVHKPEQDPKPGQMAEPTFYFEDRNSSVALKCYCRYSKLKGGGFGGPCVRLEWTLKYKAAINRYLAGNQINDFKLKDLLKADLNKFAKTNLRLEKVDRIALGKLLRGAIVGKTSMPVPVLASVKAKKVREQFEDPAYRFQRTADFVLRNLAYKERGRLGDWQRALMVCQNSPAQIRGFLRSETRKRGRPKQRTRRRVISNYRINACFQRIQLQPVG